MDNKSLEKFVVTNADGVETVFDFRELNKQLAEDEERINCEYPCPKRVFKGFRLDFLAQNKETLLYWLDCLLDYFEERNSQSGSNGFSFWFKENGEDKSAILYKGNYQDFDCAYHIIIGEDVDLFNNRDEVKDFLVYLAKCE